MKTYEEMTLEERIQWNLTRKENGIPLDPEPEPEELPKEFFNKENGLWYTLDPETWTYEPNLIVPEDEVRKPGRYSIARLNYLKEEKTAMYVDLLYSGTLNKHLNELQERCHEREDELVEEMCRKEGVTSQLQRTDWWKYVQMKENILARAREMVMDELIYD